MWIYLYIFLHLEIIKFLFNNCRWSSRREQQMNWEKWIGKELGKLWFNFNILVSFLPHHYSLELPLIPLPICFLHPPSFHAQLHHHHSANHHVPPPSFKLRFISTSPSISFNHTFISIWSSSSASIDPPFPISPFLVVSYSPYIFAPLGPLLSV
jgi:hypothetical protein